MFYICGFLASKLKQHFSLQKVAFGIKSVISLLIKIKIVNGRENFIPETNKLNPYAILCPF